MKREILISMLLFFVLSLHAQMSQKLEAAMDSFNIDSQMKFATAGFFVIDASSGATVFNQNAFTGFAPASTEKVITAATAFDILGKDYSYSTKFGIATTSKGKSLYIQASGDPTLGSWRWDETKEDSILKKLKLAIAVSGVKQFESIIISTTGWGTDDGLPSRWTWEDVGQYYGAGSQALNWRENQFDLIVNSGANIGDPVSVVGTKPFLYDYKILSEATAAGKETGDLSAIYYPSKGESYHVLKGTIPVGKNNFAISGSIYDPNRQFAKSIINEIKNIAKVKSGTIEISQITNPNVEWIYTHTSPPLSKIVYWFLRKSINLYGEALIRTIALEKKRKAETDIGVEMVQEHWKDKGVDVDELHLFDGSGLSPQNRITPHAEVAVLNYARKQNWFPEFYDGMPSYNDMKMKSGTINRVKGYTGYQKSRDGKEYVFSLLINNYNGSEYSLIRKMYKVLDLLK
ncbi:MAG TPA: D-alanyl-D-alanine carboxypeptidase/D-alanyl-D-alanine-endopeptidase [Niabella sp.]|nr:D-alanyl-D-alanine carboxypeptidase/D-alanyl-D-alanine-endopeptidase [Niabella sp.]HOZ97615.1 D-alanyl-D-alanine carboxypeptidase/D-alanyl-D-alanine-endopeptidase [Niabella sp.]HQW15753.1 D-alanyl-D-alanine carboxypeptidase/D-alanyl-D-alanine-endopeptidase [Niabella sp.]HQX21028.1 D-alanyl-D-alanine carboxypeptidase/D-alanyl-D-alanine-endopeptidase [Niabella sp.]HQX41875.1 D-alanyl-D-alanine carboxypeptidase/D-alanyl-D-alanine-endopeptidase [Niabella sp.]